MAYARKTNQNELVQLRDEITHEVNTDHPDMERMQNEQIDSLYRAAYQRDDRPFLQAEARRDPQQFLKVVERLGVSLPPPTPPPTPVLPAPTVALPGLPLTPPVAAPALAAPAPVVQVPPTAPAPSAPLVPGQPMQPAPVILGPNGQPLVPSAAGV
jgi:hypothetical protein